MPLEIRGAHFLIRSAQLVRKTRLERALLHDVSTKLSAAQHVSALAADVQLIKFSCAYSTSASLID